MNRWQHGNGGRGRRRGPGRLTPVLDGQAGRSPDGRAQDGRMPYSRRDGRAPDGELRDGRPHDGRPHDGRPQADPPVTVLADEPGPRGRGTGEGFTWRRRRPVLGRERWLSILSPIAMLLIWEILVRLGWLDARFFPPPSRVAVRFADMVADGSLFHHLGISLMRVILGFAAGAVPAVAIGLTMGLFPWVRAVLEPVVAALYPIPKIALLPLLLMIFGVGETFKVVTIALGCFTLVLVNTVAGVVNIERIYVDVARNFGASRLDFYRTVAWPGALPMIFAGLKLGMGVSLLLIVAAEMIGARSGLGYLIWNSYQVWDMAAMYIGLVLMSFFGYVFTMALNELERVVLPWRPR